MVDKLNVLDGKFKKVPTVERQETAVVKIVHPYT